MKKQMKDLQGKVEDYQRFAYILLAVSGFFYFGAVIPTIQKTEFVLTLLMVGTLVMIVAATASLLYAKRCKSTLLQLEEEQNINN
ncbi:hypothetical protein GCM10008967_33890 [Bacillus carboniphilus]|uniref:YrhC-like protein n=1 Tax=Bacillus carboniphilus TaxID=86663 RepID=A0ABP3GAT0_9BACI